MKIINIILNTIIKILNILLAITYGVFIFVYCNEKIFPSVLGWVLCVFVIMTSFVDMVRPKKIELKYNIINLVILFFMLFNIFRPFVDSFILNNLITDAGVNLVFSYHIFEQNFLLITIFIVILFLINFNFKTKL